jgi:NAD(P)-dependent dehydrogenase (short-subunit alcohol dehydrogenase family)
MPKTAVIVSVSSDIGHYLADRYLARGWEVVGTYRQKKNLKGIEGKKALLFKLDITKPPQVKAFVDHLKRRQVRWDRLICLTGSLLPAQDFFECDFGQWQDSLLVNAIGPLRLVHGLYPLRKRKAQVVFFAGGAANGAVVHMSAYAVSKIMLTKMTEFIDAEYPRLHVSIVGPGWTLTKIHDEILKGKTVSAAKRAETKNDIMHRPSTSMKDIDACVEWVCSQPKKVVSGRNFSVVYDPWRRDKSQRLVKALKKDVNMYKLRRHGNDFLHH